MEHGVVQMRHLLRSPELLHRLLAYIAPDEARALLAASRHYILLRSPEALTLLKSSLAFAESSLPSQGACPATPSCPSKAWPTVLPTASGRQWAAVGAVLGGRFYACGGFDGCQSLNFAGRFDPELDCWEALPPMLERRWAAAGAVLAGALYICGGRNGRQSLSSAERFDPELYRWEALPDMFERRWAAACAALADRLYVCAGCSDHRSLSSSEQFLPESCSPGRCGLGWELLPAMLQVRGAAKATAIAGRIYVTGSDSGQHCMNTMVERFDPERGCWEPLPATSALRLEAVASSPAGRLHILGGCGSGKSS